MFIKKITIKNFRLFPSEPTFEIENINTPDGQNEGSGLNLFVGENGCGKTSLLDAFVLPLLSYKADSFSLSDFYDPTQKTNIRIFSENDFDFKGTMPNQKSPYKGKGFLFEAGIRSRENKSYLSSIMVNDQRYIKADGQDKPQDASPDLRVSVNNPWSGSRFSENDILFLDKNRTHQTKSGTYSQTRFDRLMEDFVKILFEFSKSAQIILTTHSPLLVKQVLYNDKVKVSALKKAGSEVKVVKTEERVLPYLSANEINFIAFGLPTEEYRNELFEELKIRDDNSRQNPLNLKDFDVYFFQRDKDEAAICPYNGVDNQVSIHTQLRTQIHHRGTVGMADINQIKLSIEKMRGFLV